MRQSTLLLNAALAAFVFVVTAAVTSCGLTQEALVTQGLLTGEECAPPCFQGLVPGSSTEDEVRQFLRSGEYAVGPYAVIERSQQRVLVLKWDRRGLGGQKNEFQVQDGVLALMGMYVDSDVTLEQVVNRYGTPDSLRAGLKMSGRVYTVVSLFYQEAGMILQLHLYDEVPQLRPSTEVVRVWYFDPVPLEEAVAVLAGKKGQALEDFESEWLGYWHEWQGYGVVEPDHSYP
jgi:hypothetical protein